MKRHSRPVTFCMIVLAFGLVSLGGLSDSALAQKDTTTAQQLLSDVPADSLDKGAAKLASRIRRSIDLGDEYNRKLAVASKEDSLVLRLQLSTLTVRFMADVHKLADILIGLEEKGPQDQFRVEVEEIHRFATPRIWSHIGDLRSEIDDHRSRRLSAAGADRLALEDRITLLTDRLNDAYTYPYDYSDCHLYPETHSYLYTYPSDRTPQ